MPVDPQTEAPETDPLAALMHLACRKRLPLSATLELTYRCNLRCRHCYCDPQDSDEAGTPEVVGFLDSLAEAGVFILTLTGGESRLRPDLFEIIEAAASRGFAIRLFSNLAGWSEEHLSRLPDCQVYAVETSIYGADAATHDHLTQRAGSFESTLASVRRLVALSMRVVMKTSWTRWNFRQYDAIRRLVGELGAFYQGSVDISPCRDGSASFRECSLRDDELEAFLSGVISEDGDPETVLERYRSASREAVVPGESRSCGAGLASVRIDPRGVVYPCMDIDIVAGDLRETPFSEIWRASPILKELRERGAVSPECSACDIRGFCFRCPGVALKENGNLYARSEEACRVARTRKRALEKLVSAAS